MLLGEKTDALENARKNLVKGIARWTEGKSQADASIPQLTLHRWEAPTEPTSYMLAPSICMIGQGVKQVLLGEETYVYDARGFLVTSVDLPLVARIIEASVETPYLGLTMTLDQKVIAQLMVERELPMPRKEEAHRGMTVGRASAELLDAFHRLIDLLDEPEDIPILAPLIQKEIFYRLLTSDQGARLRQIVSSGNRNYRIARVISWLKNNFDQPLRVEELAMRSGMSPSAFHQHFRSLTAMSPLQFQKRLRLTEARRLMFAERLDAASAAFQVGYESPSQFSREYKRLYGVPPLRDIKSLHQVPAGERV